MAWLDERIWCHPKFADLSDRAFRASVHAIAYSSGFSCAGHLTPGQQAKIGADARIRAELIRFGLGDENGDGASIYIHDWADHNSKRDARRAADRERKREARKSSGQGDDK